MLDGYYKDVRIQTFLQITNTGIYLSQSNTKTLVWLNDLITKKPINGASISFSGYDQINYSKSDGVHTLIPLICLLIATTRIMAIVTTDIINT